MVNDIKYMGKLYETVLWTKENMGEVVNHDGLASNVAVFELEKTHHQIAQIWI